MGRTKKVGTAGRFGSRYGTREKYLLTAIEKQQKQKHQCPVCKKMKLRRVAAGIWQCRACNTKIAGAAYVPRREELKTEEVGEKE